MHTMGTFIQDKAFQSWGISGMKDEQVADLRHEGFKVCVGELVEFVAEVVVDAWGVAITVEIGDGHEGVEKVGAEETQ